MLIALKDDKFCAWFVDPFLDRKRPESAKDFPSRLRIGSMVIGLLASSKVFTKKDTIVYVGKKMVVSEDGKKRRQIRLVLAGGQIGFLEGYDVKNFEPVETEKCKLETNHIK